jgi:hypothetical protein
MGPTESRPHIVSGPRRGNCSQGLSWHVLLLGEELTPFTLPDEVLCIGHGGRSVEIRLAGFPHQVGKGGVVAAFAVVDLL